MRKYSDMKIKNFHEETQSVQYKTLKDKIGNPEDITKLTALLLTDGWITVRHKSTYSIGLTNNSEVLLKIFSKCIKNVFQVTTKRRILHDGTPEVYINSKKISEELWKYSPSYRTRECNKFPVCPKINNRNHYSCSNCFPVTVNNKNYPHAIIPNFVFENKELSRLFLRIAFSADGFSSISIMKKKNKFDVKMEIGIGCSHPILRKQYKTLLKKFNILSNISPTEVRIQDFNSLLNFINEIGFIEGIKISKRSKLWGKQEKQSIASLIKKVIFMKQNGFIWNSFSSKEEIYNFLLKIF